MISQLVKLANKLDQQGQYKKAEQVDDLIKIDKGKLNILWYENEAGEKWIPNLKDPYEETPKGFIYQHSEFPSVLVHNVLRLVQEDEVENCSHPSEHVHPTGGWVDGIEGRECKQCMGTQVKDTDKSWPEKWDAEGSRQFFSMESSWPEDLVLAMANEGDYSLGESILAIANTCERCMNALADKYGLKWGYPEGSEEWEKCNTECEFCKPTAEDIVNIELIEIANQLDQKGLYKEADKIDQLNVDPTVKGRKYVETEEQFIEIYRLSHIYFEQKVKKDQQGDLSDEANVQMLKAKEQLLKLIPEYLKKILQSLELMYEHNRLVVNNITDKGQDYKGAAFEYSSNRSPEEIQSLMNDLRLIRENPLPFKRDVQLPDVGFAGYVATIRDIQNAYFRSKDIINAIKNPNSVEQWSESFQIIINMLHTEYNILGQGSWVNWPTQLEANAWKSRLPAVLSLDIPEDEYAKILLQKQRDWNLNQAKGIGQEEWGKKWEKKIDKLIDESRGYWTSKPGWQARGSVRNNLVKIANQLDQKRLYREASTIDNFLRTADEQYWIGVDLDNTLAYYEPGYIEKGIIGDPIPEMLQRVLSWLAKGKKVKIFTARVAGGDTEQEELIREWLNKNGLNELEITCVKDRFMEELWDDRVVQVEKNTGKPIKVKAAQQFDKVEKDLIDIYRLMHIYLTLKNREELSDEANVQFLKIKNELKQLIKINVENIKRAFKQMFERENRFANEIYDDYERESKGSNLNKDELEIAIQIDNIKDPRSLQVERPYCNIPYGSMKWLYEMYAFCEDMLKVKDVDQIVFKYNYLINKLHSDVMLAQGVWDVLSLDPHISGSKVPDALSEDVNPDTFNEKFNLELLSKNRGYWTSKPDWQARASITNVLVKIANKFDRKGLYKEASKIDQLMKNAGKPIGQIADNIRSIANRLDRLQSNKNDGRGISSVRTIISFLRNRQIEKAIACYYNEWDKISSYPDIDAFIKQKILNLKKVSSIDPLTQREMLQTGIPLTFHTTPEFEKKHKNPQTEAEKDFQKFHEDMQKNYASLSKIANQLDQKGLYKEADRINKAIRKQNA